MIEVKIPEDLWTDTTEGALTNWYFESGDRVAPGDLVADIMVAKAVFEIEAPAAGILRRCVQVDDVVKGGDLVATIVAE
ncbi:lipoyl domain-containing protein [Spongiibacter nanhainus]|uniref:Lipoyl domain-containing protein n=1 Tax=Spongiibacter nanhainus TaxID=2794344 RepID=A0A7T4QZD0_9GAMM|nr:lipoyl domain-containing protein [Spongiibacter nanhainus]QQD17561.1 lipoyl domain-containing protein [Spongiibacter nanhainus]